MSNNTVQEILNKGYRIVDQQRVTTDGTGTISIIPASALPCNKILLMQTSIDAEGFYGDVNVSLNTGFPLLIPTQIFNGTDLEASLIPYPIEILTSKPEEYAIISALGELISVRVTYFANIQN